MTGLLPIDEALDLMLKNFHPTAPEECRTVDAMNRVLTRGITSPLSLPLFDNSAMDGYAVLAVDVASAGTDTPVSLPVAADIPAGYTGNFKLQAGTCARILTGAALPPGADAVVPVELTDQSRHPQNLALPDRVQFFTPVKPGDNVRPAGEDVKTDEPVFPEGTRLLPQHIGLLVSLGIRAVNVRRKPRVAVFSSGDELLTPGEPLSPGMIYDANRFMLMGLLRADDAEIIDLGIARDTPESVVETLDGAAAARPDLILTSAGVSVGTFDFVQQVVSREGKMTFWRVNMRPGKPIAFGEYKGIPFLGLPGNPVSAFTGFQVFTRPILRALRGLPSRGRRTVRAVLAEPVESDGRESFLRGELREEGGRMYTSLVGHQGSGNLFALAHAEVFVIVPVGVTRIEAGEEVTCWLLE
jgi:molybdopterin molybdotransferase